MKRALLKKDEEKGAKMLNKKAQESLGISFSVIFSIILIIFFIIIAGIVIKAFLENKNCTQINFFIQDFKQEVQNAWNSPRYSGDFKKSVGSGINYICFANLSSEFRGDFKEIGRDIEVFDPEDNLFFYPIGKACDVPSHKIEHLNLDIIQTSNPYCIPVKDNSFTIKIEKKFNEALVRIN